MMFVVAYMSTKFPLVQENSSVDILVDILLTLVDYIDCLQVLVRNVPPDPDESVSELVEHFFLVNHPDNYLTHQVDLCCYSLNTYSCEQYMPSHTYRSNVLQVIETK